MMVMPKNGGIERTGTNQNQTRGGGEMRFRYDEFIGQFGVVSSFLVGSIILIIAPVLSTPFFLTTFFCLYYLDLLYSKKLESSKETKKRRIE